MMIKLRSLLGSALILTSILAVACSDVDAPVALVVPISGSALLSTPPENALILDVRTREEFAAGHVPGALNIPHTEVEARLVELGGDQSRPVVVYCERGGRAEKAESQLASAGFSDLRHLEGDMSAWRASGRPIEMKIATP
jgi:phage shock protein E